MLRILAPLIFAALLATIPIGATAALVGDCNADGCVTVDELVTAVNVELGDVDAGACPAIDCNEGGLLIYINCLVVAVQSALSQPPCP